MATNNVVITGGVNNVVITAGANNVVINDPTILVETGGEFIIFDDYEGESTGQYRMVLNFISEYVGKYNIEGVFLRESQGVYDILDVELHVTDILTGQSRIIEGIIQDLVGVFDINRAYVNELLGTYDITLKRVIAEISGTFSILTGSETAVTASLDDFKITADQDPDAVAVTKFPRILTMKVWEEQSVDITLEFRKADDAIPKVKTMTWTLQDLDGTVINALEDVAVVSPTADQDFTLSGDDLQLASQANAYEWRDMVVTTTYDPEDGNADVTLIETVRFAVYNVGSVS